MSFLKRLFGTPKLDGEQMARSPQIQEYAPIDLLHAFAEPRTLHAPPEQQRWSRALPQNYTETIARFEKQGWLKNDGNGKFEITPAAESILRIYGERLAREKADSMAKVRQALEAKDTSEALSLRRSYEARFPLGEAHWTGPEPQLSHSALTRRIFFLEHRLLDGLSEQTLTWLKLYAAEQHLWGAYWQLDETEIPPYVAEDFSRLAAHDTGTPGAIAATPTVAERVYWKAYQIALYVDNQETWQRCKGGDHVRRLAIVGPDDEYTCTACRDILNTEYLVARVPELPPIACTSVRGCRCRYEPVLESAPD